MVIAQCSEGFRWSYDNWLCAEDYTMEVIPEISESTDYPPSFFTRLAAGVLLINLFIVSLTGLYLAEWRDDVANASRASILFCLLTLLTSLLIYHIWKRRKAALQALLRKQEKFRAIADYTFDWEFWLSPEGDFIHTSPACKRITGHNADEFYADPGLLSRMIHPDDRELFAGHRHDARSGTATDSMVFRIIHADGTIRWLEHLCQPIVNESGSILGTRGSNRDITERKRAEEELLLIQLCLDRAAIGIYHVSEDGTIWSANDYACRSLGYSKEELHSLNVLEIDPAITLEKILELRKSLNVFGYVTHESIHRRKDGTTFPVEITTNVVEFNGKEYPFSFVKDITERKMAEGRITRSEQKFRTIFESAHDAIFIIAGDSKYVDCNPAATELFRCGKEDLLTKNPQWFSPPCQPDGSDSEEKAKTLIEATLRGEPQCFEWRHQRPDGTEFDTVVVLSRFELEGEPMMVAIVRDISERIRLEEQLYHAQKMEAVGQLAGGVAHDFNNIITAIIGFAHLASTGMSDDDPSRNFIEQIDAAAQRAAELTQGLLAFGRKQIMVPKPVDLSETVVHLRKMLRRLIRENIELTIETSTEMLVVVADQGKMEQVLMNLVTNARDAITSGGTITIKTTRLTTADQSRSADCLVEAGEYACISVSDTGCGMSEETIKKIFEPFFTTKEVGKGTGLGLSIVYGIVKQHNGYVHVDSQPGEGTTFKICLPLADIQPDNAPSTRYEPLPFRGSETLLLAEDDAMLNNLYKTLLEEAGYYVITAVDGEEALNKFLEHRSEIALPIVDLVMPKINGKQLLKLIQAVNPQITALVVSGYSADTFNDSDLEQGKVEIMMKPIVPGELLRKVREILDRRPGEKPCP
jgi:two-component system cell cycle sensor histidine kinase/response regulator CckA